jgi:hypothetical protein
MTEISTNAQFPGESEWLSRKEAAAYLEAIGCPLTAGTLRNLAANGNAGRGPPFTRVRWKLVRYSRIDLDQWARREAVRVE